jgi:ribosomal-protein-alanine N-acetyltransferase
VKHTGTREITTGRLLLRRFVPDDAQFMFKNWASDPKVTEYMLWDAHEDVSDSRYVTDMWVKNYESDETYRWVICLLGGEPIGSVLVNVVNDDDRRGELSYLIGRGWWGKGYASEAAKAAVDYMFRHTDIERVEAHHSVNNPASGGVLRNTGLSKEGFARHKYMAKAGFQDCDLYAVVRDEWEAKAK